MLNPLSIFRRSVGAARDSYSIDEVLAILRGDQSGERAEHALDLVASPTNWLPADYRSAFGGLAWYAERLPTIFHLYRRGWKSEQIGRRMSPLGGAWAIEQTLKIAARLVAERLNRQPLAA